MRDDLEARRLVKQAASDIKAGKSFREVLGKICNPTAVNALVEKIEPLIDEAMDAGAKHGDIAMGLMVAAATFAKATEAPSQALGAMLDVAIAIVADAPEASDG